MSCYLFLFTRCTVIIFIGWIPDTSLKELFFFLCHLMHCHYLHWMDPGHQSQRVMIFFPVTRCTVIIFIRWIPDISLKELSFFLSHVALSLSLLNGSLYTVCKATFLERLEESIPLSDMYATNSCFREYIWWHT